MPTAMPRPLSSRDLVNEAIERTRELRAKVFAALELLSHASEVERTAHPNSRAYVSSGPRPTQSDAAEARARARAFVAQAEAGHSIDSSEYLRKKVEELRNR